MSGEQEQEWRPWRDLRTRSEVELVVRDLPAGVRALWCRDRRTGKRAILIDRKLSPAERLAALAHELVHDERGGAGHHGGMPDTWAPVVEREERRTDEIAARRLMPARQLEAWVDAEVGLGHQVTAERCAERFDVTVDVARRALTHLQSHRADFARGIVSA